MKYKLLETLPVEERKSMLRDPIYEKYLSLETLEQFLRKDLEMIFSQGRDSLLRPRPSTIDSLNNLPQILGTKFIQEYLDHMEEDHKFYIEQIGSSSGDSVELQCKKRQKLCIALLSKLEQLVEEEQNMKDNNSRWIDSSAMDESVENSLTWLAFKKGVGLS